MNESSGYCGCGREIECFGLAKIANMVVTGAVIRLYMSRLAVANRSPKIEVSVKNK